VGGVEEGRLRDRGNGEEEIFGGRVLIILCFSNRNWWGAQRPVYVLLSLKIRNRSMAKTQLVEEKLHIVMCSCTMTIPYK
jgi:hypothetical protein